MSEEKDAFSRYNPVLNFVFFIGAIVLGMFFIHPVFLALSVIMSAAYYIIINKNHGMKFIVTMIIFGSVISLINPIFNTYGDTVLFNYFLGRPYTLEALYYGIALSTMVISILLWFACYNAVMTSDKFLYIFGKAMPSVSLILTMVLRLIPHFKGKIRDTASIRKCIGKSVDEGSKRQKAENGLTVLSVVTSWALEGSIVTADSMRSRGYGSGKRTSFAIYRFEMRDKVLFVIMAALFIVIAACGFMGGAEAFYTPHMHIAPITSACSAIGAVCYGIFLFIPVAINLKEALIWQFLKLRI